MCHAVTSAIGPAMLTLCLCCYFFILAGTTELRLSTLLCTERVAVEWRYGLVSGRSLLRIGEDACFLGDFHGYPQSLKVYAGLVPVLGHHQFVPDPDLFFRRHSSTTVYCLI